MPLLANFPHPDLRNGITNGITAYNGITMALSNAERQKKWLERNRALHNFRRRKKAKGGDAVCQDSAVKRRRAYGSNGQPGVALIQVVFWLQDLHELTAQESSRVPVAEPVRPLVYRNDYGTIISEGQWKRLQKLKQEAKQGGYEIDEYSQ